MQGHSNLRHIGRAKNKQSSLHPKSLERIDLESGVRDMICQRDNLRKLYDDLASDLQESRKRYEEELYRLPAAKRQKLSSGYYLFLCPTKK